MRSPVVTYYPQSSSGMYSMSTQPEYRPAPPHRQPQPHGVDNPNNNIKNVDTTCSQIFKFGKSLLVVLLYVEFGLMLAEIRGMSGKLIELRSQECLEATMQGARWDKMAANLLPSTNAVGRVATYLIVAVSLSAVSVLYFLISLGRFIMRRQARQARHCHGLGPLKSLYAFGVWWDENGDITDYTGKQRPVQPEETPSIKMGTWYGDGDEGNPLKGPRVYAIVGIVIGILGYAGSGLLEWMTDSQETFRTNYSVDGYLSMAFLVLSVRHVGGMLGAVIGQLSDKPAARPIVSYVAMGVVMLALYSANSRDSFPCELEKVEYSFLSPPPKDHSPCGEWPAQEFASRPIGAYYSPVGASVQFVTSIGVLTGTSAFSPLFFCNATIALSETPKQTAASLVRFQKYLASGALLAMSPPALCASTIAASTVLPAELKQSQGYGALNVLHAWVGFRAPTSVGEKNARVTVQLLASSMGMPSPPMRWEENVYPPRFASEISPGMGGRFSLSEKDDVNSFEGKADTVVAKCGNSGSDSGCVGTWPISAVAELADGMEIGLGTFESEDWVWRIEPASRVSIDYSGLEVCAKKEL